MPLGVPMHMPFPERISPDLERAERAQYDWPERRGLLPSDRARRRHAQGRFAELAARFNPAATGDELDLSVDQMSWFFLFDDLFDGALGRSTADAARLVARVEGVLDAAPADEMPIVTAFADIWARSRAGMSAAWIERADANWRAYLRGHILETQNRLAEGDPDPAEQLAIRAETGGVRPILDLAERLAGAELPAAASSSGWMLELRQIAAEVVVLENDVVSLEKEQGIGDHNLVLHLQRRAGGSLDAAIGVVQGMVRERVDRFLELAEAAPAECRRMGLAPDAIDAVELHIRDALIAVMRGAHDWQQRAERYRPEYLEAEPVDLDAATRAAPRG